MSIGLERLSDELGAGGRGNGGGLSERLYPRLLRERWDIVRRHRSLPDLMVWTGVLAVSEVPRYAARRVLRQMGWLNPVRNLKQRLLRGGGHGEPPGR